MPKRGTETRRHEREGKKELQNSRAYERARAEFREKRLAGLLIAPVSREEPRRRRGREKKEEEKDERERERSLKRPAIAGRGPLAPFLRLLRT